jgi:ATP-dependent RNA helicase DHX29
MQPVEFSLRDVIVRYLQAYIDQAPADEAPIITQLQLDTFMEVNKAIGGGVLDHDRQNASNTLHQRLHWQDVLASYAIEKCLAHVFRTHDKTPVVRYSSPMKMFDQLSFYTKMNAKRNALEQEQNVAAAAATARSEENKQRHKSNTNPPDTQDPAANVVETLSLPIDEFKDQILHSIQNHRVTIIHGETGCGKSSRVPIMILRAADEHNTKNKDASGGDVEMFISQPRRIAAKSLVERVRSCEPDLKHKIALRMGHGEREYETGQTRAWFVTTGYLVRLLANHPERFNSVSHLVIDEVHERSVDSDVLCLLCKRLLETNPKIRLVLMSATLAANMYADYFGVSEPPIKVGGRRFPIQEFFIEDLIESLKLPAREQKGAKAIQDHCEKTKCRSAPANTYMDNLYQLAVRTTAAVGKAGSSVLIFVAGMNDIISIIDLIEKLYIPGVRFTCFPIHSDVPFEEQMAAFDKPAADEIKVIIGTNAAESSITLPDVDHVICLGLQKQIVYNAASHRQLLTPAWISRANAIQRAGRTGRVRNGNVYRLYTRKAFDEYMAKFEIGEMSRVPLDSVILSLKEMLNSEATPVLLNCLEPPELRTIERSFESLHAQQFLSTPDDEGNITNLGSFVFQYLGLISCWVP